MSDPFADLIPDASAFLSELARNNNRAWFTDHKSDYETRLKHPAGLLLEQIRAPLTELTGADVVPKLFRPNRDVRFSKDKTPYNTHLHLLWAEPDQGPGWFFGISPQYVTAGCGVMGLAKERLAHYRAAVDGPHGINLAEQLAALNARMDPPELKRVPTPYGKEHARADLLRRKSLALWRDDLSAATAPDLTGKLMAVFTSLSPVATWLRTHL